MLDYVDYNTLFSKFQIALSVLLPFRNISALIYFLNITLNRKSCFVLQMFLNRIILNKVPLPDRENEVISQIVLVRGHSPWISLIHMDFLGIKIGDWT